MHKQPARPCTHSSVLLELHVKSWSTKEALAAALMDCVLANWKKTCYTNSELIRAQTAILQRKNDVNRTLIHSHCSLINQSATSRKGPELLFWPWNTTGQLVQEILCMWKTKILLSWHSRKCLIKSGLTQIFHNDSQMTKILKTNWWLPNGLVSFVRRKRSIFYRV